MWLILACSFAGVTSYYDAKGNIKDFFKIRLSISSVLTSIGMTPSLPRLAQAGPPELLSVLLDGRVVGTMPFDLVEKAVAHLRRLKLSAVSAVCYQSLQSTCFVIFSPMYYPFSPIIYLNNLYIRFRLIWRWDIYLRAWAGDILAYFCSHALLDLSAQLETSLFLLKMAMKLNSLDPSNRFA